MSNDNVDGSPETDTGVADSGGEGATTPSTEDQGAGPEEDQRPARRRRVPRQFPPSTFEEALTLGQAIQRISGGERIRRLTLFEELGRSAESGTSRQWIVNSNQYGITTGSYRSEYLELTPDGNIASSEDADPMARLRARFRLAIERIDYFNRLYEQFKDSRLPTASVLRDFLQEGGLAPETAQECVDTFIVNAKFLGLLRNIAGAERLLTIEHAEDDLRRELGSRLGAARSQPITVPNTEQPAEDRVSTPVLRQVPTGEVPHPLDKVCFFIAPIGDEGSEFRQHSDLFMGALIEPALQQFDLQLVRADEIAQPGMITKQVIEHIVRCPLVIADLSFHNPNVFYELALRHAVRKPIVQLIRAADKLPFDVQQFRTIVIDTTSIYTLVPQIETYRSEIAAQIRTTLDEADQAENPLSLFYPGFWDSMQRRG